jgi:hypothetical protein
MGPLVLTSFSTLWWPILRNYYCYPSSHQCTEYTIEYARKEIPRLTEMINILRLLGSVLVGVYKALFMIMWM